MYVPGPFRARQQEALTELIVRRPLATLCARAPGELAVVHVPLLLDADVPEPRLVGHVARQGPVARAHGADAVAVFTGEQGYISPSWYPSKSVHGRVVPTWDYETVHVHGTLRVIEDPDVVLTHVRMLTDRMETPRTDPWSIDDAPPGYIASLLDAIVAIDIPIERMEAQFKLSQNKQPDDVAGVLEGLGRVSEPSSQQLAARIVQHSDPTTR